MPDRRMKRSSFLFCRLSSPFVFFQPFFSSTTSQAIIRTTHVRMAVARLDSTPVMPILARMEVRAAKRAERMA